MKYMGALVVSYFISLSGCSVEEPENMVRYYDSHTYNHFVEKLDEHKVRYRTTENMEVYYPVSQSQIVDAIKTEVRAKRNPGCAVSFTSEKKQKIMESTLKSRGIPYTVVNTDAGQQITCSPTYKDAVNELLMQVLRGEIE